MEKDIESDDGTISHTHKESNTIETIYIEGNYDGGDCKEFVYLLIYNYYFKLIKYRLIQIILF